MKRIFSALVLAFLFSARPAMAVLAFETNPQDVDKIIVVGLEAQVQLLGQANATKLRVTGIDDTTEPGNFALERKDRVLYIKMQEFGDKKEWKEVLTRPRKRKIIEFAGASVPVEIQLRDGVVTSQRWQKELKIAVVKGKVTSVGGSASLTIQMQTGDVSVQDQSSKLSADVYKGQLLVRNLQGDLEGSVFTGGLTVEKSKGFLSIDTAQANAKIVNSSGTLQFDNVKGSLIAQQFSGRVDGQTQEGGVQVSVLADSDVHVKSVSGRVYVGTAPGSGAFINVMTGDGEITVPGELRVAKSSTEKSAKGRLRGSEQKGSVVVRSQEGSIVIK